MESSSYRKRLFSVIIVSFGVVIGMIFLFFFKGESKGDSNFSASYFDGGIYFIQGNSIIVPNNPSLFSPPSTTKKVSAILTAYSSSIDETWGDPYITASGERVRDGIVANNCLPFGTIVEIDGMYFEVLDRKNSRYGCEWFDIWKDGKESALQFGIKRDYIKIY